jgi:ATP-dependent 26S proteasome regulatory subunit
VLAATVDLHKISKQYEIAGGAIMNVIRYASLMSINKGSNVITLENIEEGIKKEYHKEGRTI